MKKIFSKSNLIGFTLVAVLAGSSTLALAGPHGKGEGKTHSLERMIKHLDLSETQKEQAESIFASTEADRAGKKGMPKMRALMHLNPEAPDYLQQVEEHANAASEQMKAHIIKMANARQQIHAILTEEQKQEMKALMEKKMKRMEKRYKED